MNKYSSLHTFNADMVLNGRSIITRIYPETIPLYDRMGTQGCASCGKSSVSRAILLLILETPKGDRDVAGLKKCLPADFVASL